MRNKLLKKYGVGGIRRRHPGGFSLVEVLVAIVVLSVGVLGAIGLQAASLQSSKEVRNQALAGSLVKELGERMRGNNTIAIAPLAANNPYLMNVVLPRTQSISAASTNCATTACNAAQIAAFDVWEWQVRLRDALPSPRVTVCMDATPFDASGIPQWACTNTGDVAVLKLAWNRTNTKGELEMTALNSNTSPPLMVLSLTAGSTQ